MGVTQLLSKCLFAIFIYCYVSTSVLASISVGYFWSQNIYQETETQQINEFQSCDKRSDIAQKNIGIYAKESLQQLKYNIWIDLAKTMIDYFGSEVEHVMTTRTFCTDINY